MATNQTQFLSDEVFGQYILPLMLITEKNCHFVPKYVLELTNNIVGLFQHCGVIDQCQFVHLSLLFIASTLSGLFHFGFNMDKI